MVSTPNRGAACVPACTLDVLWATTSTGSVGLLAVWATTPTGSVGLPFPDLTSHMSHACCGLGPHSDYDQHIFLTLAMPVHYHCLMHLIHHFMGICESGVLFHGRR
jgi:hypothetical protein